MRSIQDVRVCLAHRCRYVISERSHAADEAEFRGIVHFVDGMDAAAKAFESLTGSEDGRRRAEDLAREGARRFRRRFQAEAIFRRAGVYGEVLAA